MQKYKHFNQEKCWLIICNTKLNPTLNATLRAADVCDRWAANIFFFLLITHFVPLALSTNWISLLKYNFDNFWSKNVTSFIHRDPNRPPSFGPKRSYHSRGAQTDLLWSKNVKSFMGRPQLTWQPKNVTWLTRGPNWPLRCLDFLDPEAVSLHHCPDRKRLWWWKTSWTCWLGLWDRARGVLGDHQQEYQGPSNKKR